MEFDLFWNWFNKCVFKVKSYEFDYFIIWINGGSSLFKRLFFLFIFFDEGDKCNFVVVLDFNWVIGFFNYFK